MENALLAAKVPFQLLQGLGLLGREVVGDALAYLQLAAHPDDGGAFERIFNKPARAIGVPSHLPVWLHPLTQSSSHAVPVSTSCSNPLRCVGRACTCSIASTSSPILTC